MNGLLRFGLLASLAFGFAACDGLPGRPDPADRPVPAAEVRDFETLYATNCAGCHGTDGTMGAARPLADPVYLAWVPEAEIVDITRRGVTGTAMPAFAIAEGGVLTEAQVQIIASGLRSLSTTKSAASAPRPPPYRARLEGRVEHGRVSYATYCAECHGADARGGAKGGSIVDPSYLALVSDQALRSTVVCGRVDLGMPGWRGHDGSDPMSAQSIADVVAFIADHRIEFPGPPVARSTAQEEGR